MIIYLKFSHTNRINATFYNIRNIIRTTYIVVDLFNGKLRRHEMTIKGNAFLDILHIIIFQKKKHVLNRVTWKFTAVMY